MRIPGKIPVTINPGFWVSAAFIGFIITSSLKGTPLLMLVILVSVLVHEFGHALVALLFGKRPSVELVAFGGHTIHENTGLKLWQEFFIVLSGPLAGMALAAIAYYAPFRSSFLYFVFYINVFWSIMNLMPVGTLDGGRLLQIILQAIFGVKGIRFASLIGFIVGVFVSITFFLKGWFWGGAVFLILAFDSKRAYAASKKMTTKDTDANVHRIFLEAKKDAEEGRVNQALEKLARIRESNEKGAFYTLATENMAVIFDMQGRFKEAYDMLVSIGDELSPPSISLLHSLAYSQRDYPLVLELSSPRFQQEQTSDVAIMNAIASAVISDTKAVVGWLQAALRTKMEVNEIISVVKRVEFDSVRKDSKFQEFIHSL